MLVVRELLRIVAWVICSVLLVLLVPSSAWSASTESPQPSPSSSPSDGSSSGATPEPTPTETTTTEPTPSETPTPTPEPTVTVTVTPEPVDQEPTCTASSPCVMEPSKPWVSFQLLTAGVSMLALLGLLVRSFAPR